MPRRKLTQEEVITQFREVHGDKYDYSKVEYKGDNKKVTIICKEHGEFPQKPDNHKQGQGCKKCYRYNKLTQEQVIEQFREVHGNKYDYSKVEYKGDNKKVTIICPKHGEFPQKPNNHKQGQGCKKCYHETPSPKKLTQEEVISQFREVHGDTYDYSKVVYTGIDNHVTIICPKHGEFPQKPNNHKQGQGCKKCYHEIIPPHNKLTQEEVIPQFREVHGTKYDYSLVEYVNCKTHVTIICPKHGEFPQKPNNHKSGHGCPKCNAERYFVGKNEGEVFIPFMRDILSNYDVTLSEQHIVEQEIGRYFIDLYIPEMKLAIEYDELGHNYKKEKDKERQTYIENKLGCTFIRVDDKRFMDDNKYATTLLSTYFPNIKKETIEDLFI